MIKTKPKTDFPSHAVSKEEKQSEDYGMQVAKSIEGEWFRKEGGDIRYFATRGNYHRLRLYARGEQPIEKYKNEMAINGDTSYLNLDWKPIPIIPKFVDIVVNGISERPYSIRCFAQDPHSMEKRTAYVEGMIRDIQNRELFEAMDEELGINMFQNDPEFLPEDEEELSLHMQLDYKESIEIAQEEALSNVFTLNKYDLIKRRLDYDITVLGIAAVKHEFNTAEGIVIKYVDPSDIVYSYTDSPYFEDIYYVGEVRRITVAELKKQFPKLTLEDIEEIETTYSSNSAFDGGRSDRVNEDGYIYVMYFEYKTFEDQVYKIKHTASGGLKAIEKPDTFNPPKDARADFEKVHRSIEVLYCGAKVVGCEKLLKWELSENMTRPKSDVTRVNMSYSIVAPRMYNGRPESLVSRMISPADAVQKIDLKLQQVIARLVPDGVFLDADGLSEVDLGGGTAYSPQEALNMFFQTGSVVGRSMTQDGDFNNGRVPIQEIQTSGGNAKIASLITAYNHQLQMIRDMTGLNEARDGSSPDKTALVGVQKLAAANSNTATRHIVYGGLYLTQRVAEGVVLRVSDVLEYANTRESFIQSLGRFNVATLTEIKELHIHDFGIYISLAPDEEEKAILENNIQMALNKDQIYLEDAIDVREVNNLKLANQLLKVRRRKKMNQDREQQMENIALQSQSNAKSAQAAAQADIQKAQGEAAAKIEIEKAKSLFSIEKLQMEKEAKKELMLLEYNLNLNIEKSKYDVIKEGERYKEDRKDERTKLQASQQSELIEQRQNQTPPKRFESSGNDTLGGFGLEAFDPR
jgi:hypothetical protein